MRGFCVSCPFLPGPSRLATCAAGADAPTSSQPESPLVRAAEGQLARLLHSSSGGPGQVSFGETLVRAALRQLGVPGFEPAPGDASLEEEMVVPEIILDTIRAMAAENRVGEFFPGLQGRPAAHSPCARCRRNDDFAHA